MTDENTIERTLEWLQETTRDYINVVLVGGGHAHCIALKTLATHQTDEFCMHCHKIRLILVSNASNSYYSGMLPGCIWKMYSEDLMQIQLDQLCSSYGVSFIKGEACAIDSQQQQLTFTYEKKGQYSSAVLQYDILSVDVGSVNPSIPGYEHALTTRPISQLMQKIQHFEDVFYSAPLERTLDIVVVGGGLEE
jgi:NADH dehydrogenase FAD-containing subunit